MLRLERIIATVLLSFFLGNQLFSQEFTLPAFIDDITSCDIDLDEDIDIICICQILNYEKDSIFIFYNNGVGGFQRKGYHYPNSGFILCGCMDGNDFPDLITRLSFNVFYAPNNGLEGFGEMVTIDDNMGGNLSIISDVNMDNWNDLIFSVTDYENWGVYKNIDGLQFVKVIIQSGSSTTEPGVGFITDDSLPDIVLSYSAFDRTSVHVNNGNLNFSEIVLEDNFNYETPVMNLDNQGTDDFAFVNYATNKVALYKYLENNQFELQSNFYASGTYGIDSFIADDFNQDGYDDFAIRRCNWYECTDSIYIYFNDHNWSFNLNQTLYIGEWNWYKALTEDLNGDFFPDIIMKGYNGNNILTLLWNDGNGNFSFENPVKIAEISPLYCELDVFPNPFIDNLTIKLNTNLLEDYSIFISNIYGKILKSFYIKCSELKSNNKIIWDGKDDNKSACSPGIYLITLKSNSDQVLKKVIKY